MVLKKIHYAIIALFFFFTLLPVAFAHVQPLASIVTDLSIENNKINLYTTLLHNSNIKSFLPSEQKNLYQKYFDANFLITQNNNNCTFKLTAVNSSISSPDNKFWGVFTCPQTVNLNNITIQSTLFSDEFSTFDHFATINFNNKQYQILFTQTYNKYPEQLIARDTGVVSHTELQAPTDTITAPNKVLQKNKNETYSTGTPPTTSLIEKKYASSSTVIFPETNKEIISFLTVTKTFTWMGMLHIFTGYDHVLFLLSILLLTRKIKKLFGIITAFTLAHSITLILASLNIVEISAHIVEPTIALTIGFTASMNIHKLWKSNTELHKNQEIILLTFCFGLIHGLGFASALTESGIPKDFFISSLLSFNIGIEFGQLCILAIVLPFLLLIDRWKSRKIILTILSSAILLLALMWFSVRAFIGESCTQVLSPTTSKILCI